LTLSNSALTTASGNVFAFDVDRTGVALTSDNLRLNTGSTALSGIISLATITGSEAMQLGNIFTLFTLTNVTGVPASSVFQSLSVAAVNLGGFDWQLVGATGGNINIVAIPEPSIIAAAIIGSGIMLRRRREML